MWFESRIRIVTILWFELRIVNKGKYYWFESRITNKKTDPNNAQFCGWHQAWAWSGSLIRIIFLLISRSVIRINLLKGSVIRDSDHIVNSTCDPWSGSFLFYHGSLLFYNRHLWLNYSDYFLLFFSKCYNLSFYFLLFKFILYFYIMFFFIVFTFKKIIWWVLVL